MWAFTVCLVILGLMVGGVSAAQAEHAPQPKDRYFLSGDGVVQLSNGKNGRAGKVRYRLPDGSYPQAARQQIDRIFGIAASADEQMSLRFISLLDYFEDRFGRPIQVISGYRSPAYNAQLRKQGRLAAQTSLHMEGMAADIQVGKRLGAQAFEIIKGLNCCGVGYYHGGSLHLDTGPARYWDETSSKVGTDISDHNKRIMVRTDKDVYIAGETVELRLARITDYPLGLVSGFDIVKNGQVLQEFSLNGDEQSCLAVRDPRDKKMHWTIPSDFQTAEKVHIQLRFCNKPFPEMLDQIESNAVIIRSPRW